ncbi:MAG TPA: fatty acid desaturase [Pirellulales bacterium]|jgi:fatty acid desaturase|nr:fatty acid desaturase [Pirellulales bacterium]
MGILIFPYDPARMTDMLSGAHCSRNFSIRQAREIVKDLFVPNAAIYWSDFLLSIGLGAICFQIVRQATPFTAAQAIAYVVSCLAFYRAALFIHELVHLRSGTFGAFRVTWNLLCGIPFFMPSFLYHTHVAHHARKHYGTREDGEYLPLGAGPRRDILLYLCQPFVIPLLAIVRFAIFTPIAWISPGFRRFVHERASSMVMDPGYVRPLPTTRELRLWRLQEAACFLYAVGAALLLYRGRLPWSLLLQGYLTALGVIMLNHVRTLGAHRFRHQGEALSFVDQLLDSVNYPNHPLIAGLWGPVGLRFHALHHLFPSLPYHSLAKAHRRLMAQLPADSPYRQTECPSLRHALVELWCGARAANASVQSSRAAGNVPHPTN